MNFSRKLVLAGPFLVIALTLGVYFALGVSAQGNADTFTQVTLNQEKSVNQERSASGSFGTYSLICGGCDLSFIQFPSEDLSSAWLSSANLTGANLTNVDMTNANLTTTNLTAAVMIGAVLTGGVLIRANLTGVVLTRANLGGVDLTGV